MKPLFQHLVEAESFKYHEVFSINNLESKSMETYAICVNSTFAKTGI